LEEIMSKQLLIDARPIKLSLQESEGGKMVARGEFARCDVPTQNGRTYPRGVYEREVKKLQESVASRRAFGELDHPEDGKTKLSRVSHVITKLEIDRNGVVIGEAEILNTPNGQTLKAILDAGAEVGVSSRGFGSTKQMPDGSQVVGEDFTLRSFDFVADPAMKSAYPQIFAEDVEVEFNEDSLLDEFPHLAEDIRMRERESARRNAEAAVADVMSKSETRIRQEMREAFEQRLAESLSNVRESVGSTIREEFESDPEIAGARAILNKISEMVGSFSGKQDDLVLRDALRAKEIEISALRSSKDSEIADIRESLGKAKEFARVASLTLVLEHSIGGHPKADRIRKLIGDISSYGDSAELSGRISDIVSEYDDFESERRSFEESRTTGQIQSLMDRIDALERDLSEARNSLEQVEADAEERIAEIELEAEERIASISEESSNKVASMKESLDSKLSSVSAEKNSLQRKLNEAIELAESFRDKAENADLIAEESRLDAYKSRKISGLANAPRLRKMLENVDNEDAIDQIVQESGNRRIVNEDLHAMQQKLRRGQPHDNTKITESVEKSSILQDPMLGGLSTNQMLELSGVKRAR
jgi:hypothetical protein